MGECWAIIIRRFEWPLVRKAVHKCSLFTIINPEISGITNPDTSVLPTNQTTSITSIVNDPETSNK